MLLCASGVNLCAQEPAAPASPAGIEYFEKHIRPLLVKHCYECHSVEAQTEEGWLKLDSREAILKGGKSGAAIMPGDPEHSRLILAVRYTDPLLQMPPDDKLTDREIEALTEWVRMGAPDPR